VCDQGGGGVGAKVADIRGGQDAKLAAMQTGLVVSRCLLPWRPASHIKRSSDD
jgi:hypothetical protein